MNNKHKKITEATNKPIEKEKEIDRESGKKAKLNCSLL